MRTIAQAITDLATKAKGSQAVPRGRKITDALDALADAMAGTDVPLARCTTIVNAIDTITANYGGGGGVDVGAPTFVISGNAAPETGGYITNTDVIAGVTIGGTTIVPIDPYNTMFSVASGATATTRPDEELSPTTCDAYVVTVNDDEFTAVSPWDGTLTHGTWAGNSGDLNVWSFEVPALEYDFETSTGQILYLHMH